MQKCSEKAYAMCPDRHLCGPIDDAVFADSSECDAFNRYAEDAPMSNAKRFRSMNDEELSEFINGVVPCDCCVYDGICTDYVNTQKCRDGVIQWLQKTAERGADDGKEG